MASGRTNVYKLCSRQSTSQSCIYLVAGQMYNVSQTYSNVNSNVDFNLIPSIGNKYGIANCSVTNVTNCVNHITNFNAVINGDHVLLTFKADIYIKGIEVILDSQPAKNVCFTITAKLDTFKCTSREIGFQIYIVCIAPDVYPGQRNGVCTLYKKNAQTVISISNTNTPNTSLYNLNCTFSLTQLDSVENSYVISLKYLTTTKNDSLDISYTDLKIKTWTKDLGVLTLNHSITLTCETSLIPADQITIQRRYLRQTLKTSTNAWRLQHTINMFNCQNVDQYVCIISNKTETRSSELALYPNFECAPRADHLSQESRTFSVQQGHDLFFSSDIFSLNCKDLVFSIWFEERDQVFLARTELYTVSCNNYSLFYCSANVAMYDFRESDYKTYILNIKYRGLETGLQFTVQPTGSDVDYKDAVIGVSVTAGFLLLIVVSLVVVLVCLWRRRENPGRATVNNSRKSSQTILKQELYDDMNQSENYHHSYGEHTLQNTPVRRLSSIEEEKYEIMTTGRHLQDQQTRGTTTSPANYKSNKASAVTKPKNRLAQNSRTEEFAGPTREQELYGNIQDHQPVYGNIDPHS
uniref:Ig-like domain-containing protein n=1 Tax=Biomphalaria glabrata TaxID=6526 RepID=A0A2C9M9R3_BIOGL